MTNAKFKIGETVFKDTGDYTFNGVIVAAFQNKKGSWRYVVENNEGFLHTSNGLDLKKDITRDTILGTCQASCEMMGG